jgi:hypothetical protein
VAEVSGRTISVRLQTLCGCTKHIVVPGPAPEQIEVPIIALDSSEPRHKMRRFLLNRLNPSDIAVEADYREVPDLP